MQVGRLRKIYFYDLGMRNALIDDFGPLELRGDVGALWENFVLVERLKKNQADQRYTRSYYWRSRDKQEIDLVEESGGKIVAFECKWNKQPRIPRGFTAAYPDITVVGITKTTSGNHCIPEYRVNCGFKRGSPLSLHHLEIFDRLTQTTAME